MPDDVLGIRGMLKMLMPLMSLDFDLLRYRASSFVVYNSALEAREFGLLKKTLSLIWGHCRDLFTRPINTFRG
jgi:hypothetical protein